MNEVNERKETVQLALHKNHQDENSLPFFSWKSADGTDWNGPLELQRAEIVASIKPMLVEKKGPKGIFYSAGYVTITWTGDTRVVVDDITGASSKRGTGVLLAVEKVDTKAVVDALGGLTW